MTRYLLGVAALLGYAAAHSAGRRYGPWLHAEVVYLAYRIGLRGYCLPCDRGRWAWTHRGHGCLGHRAGWYR